MKTGIILLGVFLLGLVHAAPAAPADLDLAVGAFGGMNIPVINDDMEEGMMYGFQARLSFLGFLGIGGFYEARSPGNPEQTFFAGSPLEVVMEKDGGDVTAYGADLYLGRSGGTPGVNVFLIGTVARYQWKRDNLGDITKVSYSVGPGLELLFPFGLGIEGRGMFEVVPTENEDASWKNFMWSVGVNFHLGLMRQH